MVPDSILFKKEPLTRKEYENIKRHVVIGYRIVQHFTNLKSLAPLVLDHHQWWNGQGYPNDKKGEDINPLSRIFHVADALDSMIGYRPYRCPIHLSKALKILQQGAGIQFDPLVVKNVMQCIESSLLQKEVLFS